MDVSRKGFTPESLARALVTGASEGVDALSESRLRKCARHIPNGGFFREMMTFVPEDVRADVQVRLRRILGSKIGE